MATKKKKNAVQGATRLGYTPDHAASGLDHNFPAIECWPNQFPGYEIEIDIPEFTSVCPEDRAAGLRHGLDSLRSR